MAGSSNVVIILWRQVVCVAIDSNRVWLEKVTVHDACFVGRSRR